MDIERHPCIKINAPEFFAREDFAEFLRRGAHDEDANPVATWHRGEEPGDYSDLFVTYDHGEGSDALPNGGDESDANLIPQDIWDQICREMERRGVEFALLWITNLGAAGKTADVEPEGPAVG